MCVCVADKENVRQKTVRFMQAQKTEISHTCTCPKQGKTKHVCVCVCEQRKIQNKRERESHTSGERRWWWDRDSNNNDPIIPTVGFAPTSPSEAERIAIMPSRFVRFRLECATSSWCAWFCESLPGHACNKTDMMKRWCVKSRLAKTFWLRIMH